MGNEMMNRFLGIALEMVFNRHRRRENSILVALFCSFLLLFWFYSFYGNTSSSTIGAKETPEQSMLEILFPYINMAFGDPAAANMSPPASALLPKTTSGNDIQWLLLLTYSILITPWIRKTQPETQTIHNQT